MFLRFKVVRVAASPSVPQRSALGGERVVVPSIQTGRARALVLRLDTRKCCRFVICLIEKQTIFGKVRENENPLPKCAVSCTV